MCVYRKYYDFPERHRACLALGSNRTEQERCCPCEERLVSSNFAVSSNCSVCEPPLIVVCSSRLPPQGKKTPLFPQPYDRTPPTPPMTSKSGAAALPGVCFACKPRFAPETVA